MLKEPWNGWTIGMHSIIDITQYTPMVSSLWNKETFNIHRMDETRIKKPDVLLGYLIILWTVLYLTYEKFLNSLLRRMRIPLMQRTRIIQATWSCGFCFGSVCYLRSSVIKSISFLSDERLTASEEFGVILHKSFYFHRAGIEIFNHRAWTKGLANLLFASFIMKPYQETWCTIVSTFLFYKAINEIVISVCRILLCLPQYVGRRLPILFFSIHCISWLHLYAFFVPKLMLWPEHTNYPRAQLGLWLWFTVECLDSVWFRLISCARATHWLEICLFPRPSQEAIELAGIQKRHRDSLKRLVKRTSKKAELWQTLFCAVALKKKIKRIRQAKQNNSISAIDTVEEDLTELVTEEESKLQQQNES